MIGGGCVPESGWPTDLPPVRPVEEIDLTRPLLALDVDGPLNRWDGLRKSELVAGPETRMVTVGNGDTMRFDFYPERIAELDRIVRTHDVNIAWLTSWGGNIVPLVEQAFDGLLAGGFVLRRKPRKIRGVFEEDWKFNGLLAHLRAFPTVWAWAEDETIAEVGPDRIQSLFDAAPNGLVLDVDERTMITEAQLAELDALFARDA